jgi:hypothetical protein
MITFVTWKWRNPNSAKRCFESAHVNVLRAMIAKHYPRKFRMVCITDDNTWLDAKIDALPMPVRFDDIVDVLLARA